MNHHAWSRAWMSTLFPGINTDFQGSQTLFPLYGEGRLRCALTLRLVSFFTQHTVSFSIKLSSGIYSPLIMRPPNVFITSLSHSFIQVLTKQFLLFYETYLVPPTKISFHVKLGRAFKYMKAGCFIMTATIST